MPSNRPPIGRSRREPLPTRWRSWKWKRCRSPICQATRRAFGAKRWEIWPVAKSARNLTMDDIRALEIGAAILGTGGGGNPHIGRLRTEQLLKAGKTIRLIPLSDLGDEDIVVSVGGIGAPVVGIEKIERGDECYCA